MAPKVDPISQILVGMLPTEKFVVGICLRERKAVGEFLSAGLRADHFQHDEPRRIFELIIRAESQQRPFDLASLRPELVAENLLAFASEAEANAPDAVSTEVHAKELCGANWALNTTTFGQRLAALADRKPYDDLTPYRARFAARVDELLVEQARDASKGKAPAQFLREDIVPELERLLRGETSNTNVPTGLPTLDEFTYGGFERGAMTTVGGRPGCGKTTFGLNVASHAAAAGHRVSFFSAEVRGSALTKKLWSLRTRIHYSKIRRGQLTELERNKLAAEPLESIPIDIFDDFSNSFETLKLIVESKVRQKAVDLVVVDYLQLLSSSLRFSNRQETVAHISRELKALANKSNVAILALCQLNRDVEKNGGAPQLHNIRESGAIEQDSDVIMFVHRYPIGESDTLGDDEFQYQLLVAKNRFGETGGIWLDANMAICEFKEASAPRQLPASAFPKSKDWKKIANNAMPHFQDRD